MIRKAENKTLRGRVADLTKETSDDPTSEAISSSRFSNPVFGEAAATGGSTRAGAGRLGGGSGATGGAPTRGSAASPAAGAGRLPAAAPSRRDFDRRSTAMLPGRAAGREAAARRPRRGARRGSAAPSEPLAARAPDVRIPAGGSAAASSARRAAAVPAAALSPGSLRNSTRGSARCAIGSGEKPTSGSVRRSGGGAGRRISSAKRRPRLPRRRFGHRRLGMVESVGAGSVAIAPLLSGSGAIRRRRLGTADRALRHLVPRRHRADDIRLHHDVGWAADHQEMFDIVAPHQHQPAAAVDGRGIDHREARHPAAIGIGAQAVSGELAKPPTPQRRSAPARPRKRK